MLSLSSFAQAPGGHYVSVWGETPGLGSAPAGITNVTAVSANTTLGLALWENGNVAQWGASSLGIPNGTAIYTGAKAIAAGALHAVVLKTNGTVTAWSFTPLYRTAVVPPDATNITEISAGAYHTLALNDSGRVIAWGKTTSGQSVVPTNLAGVVSVAAGGEFSLALCKDRSVVSWGAAAGTPPPLKNVEAIAAGSSHALALLNDGSVVAWGDNTFGKTNVPSEATNVVAIAAGPNHSLALRADGTVVAWGKPGSPISVPQELSNVVAIAASVTNSYAVVGNGSPVVATSPRDRSLPAGTPLILRAFAAGQQPVAIQWLYNGVPIEGATGVTYSLPIAQVEASGQYSFVASNTLGMVTSMVAQVTVTPSRSVAGWGVNGSGQTDVPANLTNVLKVVAGGEHSLALLEGGKLVTWGSTNWRACEIPVTATNLVDVAAGNRFSAAVRKDGKVLVWGGTNGTLTSSVPQQPPGVEPAQGIAAGLSIVVVIRQGGSVAAWGNTATLRPMTSPSLSGIAAVAAGWEHCVALRSNGTVYCWGPVVPQLSAVTNTPPGLTNVVAIAAGNYHTLALKADGTVVAWGYYPEISEGAKALTNVVSIAAGFQTAMAVTADGKFISWGIPRLNPDDLSDRSIPASVPRNITSLSCGGGHVVAITTDPRPCITQPPRSRSVPLGWPVTFTSAVSGQGVIGYQWQLNGVDVANGTNSSLAIPLVSDANPGEYRVIATNSLGSVTSQVARLVRGDILVWGDNAVEQCWTPASATNVVQLAAGYGHTLGLRDDGTVVPWGSFHSKHLESLQGVSNVRTIAAGGDSGLAILNDGTLRAWSQFPKAVNVPMGSGVVSADFTDQDQGVATLEDGHVVTWGAPDAAWTNMSLSLSNVARITAGRYYAALALGYDGTLQLWGGNLKTRWTNVVQVTRIDTTMPSLPQGYALLADGTVRDLAYGSRVAGLTNVVSIAGSAGQLMALRSDGTVYINSARMTAPAVLSNVVEIACGVDYQMVRFGDGSPNLTIEPYSRTVVAGSPFVLTAFASGTQPLSYQWRHNGQEIAGATNASYEVNSAALGSMGAYQCVISNAQGSVTSKLAQVTVSFPPPQLSVVAAAGEWQTNGFIFRVENLSGQGPAIVYASTNLVDWLPLLTNPPGPASFEMEDALSTSSRFYRVTEERN